MELIKSLAPQEIQNFEKMQRSMALDNLDERKQAQELLQKVLYGLKYDNWDASY